MRAWGLVFVTNNSGIGGKDKVNGVGIQVHEWQYDSLGLLLVTKNSGDGDKVTRKNLNVSLFIHQ